MSNSISLSSGMSANLLSLQNTATSVGQTQERLSSGKKVNSALDNPLSYFASQALNSRAKDLTALKDGMGQAIQTIKAANTGVTGILTLISTAQGLAQAARTSTGTDLTNLVTQYSAIQTQITNLAADSGYQGTNLLTAGVSLSVQFNETATNSLGLAGIGSSSGCLGLSSAAGSWATGANIDTDVAKLTAATNTLRGTASTLSSNLSVITTRQDFTTNLVNTLTTGADELVNADMNQESANMLALQTRQSLGISALSLSSQANQSILKLF